MKNKFLLFVFILTNTCFFSQPTFNYAKAVCRNTAHAKSCLTDNAGNLYFIGTIFGTSSNDFDPGPGTANLTSNGGNDICIAKYDAAGNYIWAKKIGGIGNDLAYEMVMDANSNLYLAGTFSSTVDFDPNAGVTNLTASNIDGFFAKYTSSGNLVWAKKIGSASSDFIRGIDISGSNIYITGSFAFNVDFDPGPGGYILSDPSGYGSSFFGKYDTSSAFIWANSISGTGINGSEGDDIVVDASGDCFVTGYFGGTNVDFDPGPSTAYLSSPSSAGGIYLAKYSSTGNYINAFRPGSNSTGGLGFSYKSTFLSLDNANNVYISGNWSGSNSDFDPGPGTAILSGNSNFIAKYSNSCNYIFAYTYVGSTMQNGMFVDPAGGIYLVGTFSGTMDFNYGPGTNNLTATASGSSAFLTKLDLNGNFLWVICPGSISDTEGKAVHYSNSTLYVCNDANTNSCPNYDYDPGPAVANPVGNFCFGIHYVKYSDCTLAPNQPGSITGATNVCQGSGATSYSTPIVAGASSYAWVLPGGWSGTSTTNTISATPGSSGGNVSVTANNACGSSSASVLSVTVNSSPTITVNSGSVCSGSSFTMTPSGASTYTYSSGSAIVSPTSTTSYSVTGTSTTGCVGSNTAVASVMVNTSPTIAVNSGSICSGSSFTMSPSGASTYTFSSGSAIVSPTTNTSYSVTGTSSAGCVGSNTAVASVTVNTFPAAPGLINGINSMCPGAGTTNYSVTPVVGATSYSWSLPGLGWSGTSITNTISLTPGSGSGNLSVIATNACGSSSASVLSITVNTLPTISVNSGSICSGSSFTMSPSGASTYTFSSGSAIVSPTATTSYSVTGTSSAGCVGSNTAVASVTVNTAPSMPGAISGTSVMCSNYGPAGYNVLPVPGATSYTWLLPPGWTGSSTNNNIIGTPGSSGTMSITANNICGNSVTQTLLITVNPLPTVAANTSATIICGPPFQGTATITASGANTYVWNTTATTTAIAVSPSITTVYTVTGTDANGCVNSTSFTQSVSACTNVMLGVVETSAISLYPNPTSGIVTINAKAGLQVAVYNIIGELVLLTELKSDTAEINLNEQANGIYFIRIGSVTKKVIKE